MYIALLGWFLFIIAAFVAWVYRMLWLDECDNREIVQTTLDWMHHGDHPEQFEELG